MRVMRRRGISLIEVIACTAIIAVMMVPLAGVMRSSRQAIQRAESISTETELRDSSSWLKRLVQDNQVLDVSSDALALRLSTGVDVKVFRDREGLVMSDGRDQTILQENVTRVQFGAVKQSVAPNPTIGIKMEIEAVDPDSKQSYQRSSIISLPPQF